MDVSFFPVLSLKKATGKEKNAENSGSIFKFFDEVSDFFKPNPLFANMGDGTYFSPLCVKSHLFRITKRHDFRLDWAKISRRRWEK